MLEKTQIKINCVNNQLITTSLNICEVFNKPHKNILKTIEELECSANFKSANFLADYYIDSRNRKQKKFLITRDGFTILAMGFTGLKAMQFKELYIKQFNEMEQQLKHQQLGDTYNYYTSDLISKDLTNLDIVRMDGNYNKERPCYWCPTVCTCGHCGIAKHLQVDQKNSINLHCIFEKMIRSEIDKDYKQYDLLYKVIYDLVKTNRQIDWELGFNWDFLQRICDLAFIGYKAKYKYDTINNKPEEVKKRLCMA